MFIQYFISNALLELYTNLNSDINQLGKIVQMERRT